MAAGLSFAIETLGCKTNQVESDAIADLLVRHGHRRVPFDTRADVYIVNTCTVTQTGDRKSRQLIRRAKKSNPDSVVVVMGCYSQLSPAEVAAIDGVDYVLGTSNRTAVLDLIGSASGVRAPQKSSVTDIMTITEFEDIPIYRIDGHTRAFIKIQEGCEQYCSYCIIPYARGRVRSRDAASISDEVNRLCEQGFAEFVLTGIHIGSYGRDLAAGSLIDIVEMIASKPGARRIRLGSIEPRTIDDMFCCRLAGCGKLCDHFHLSLQSGSDAILRRMNRKYSVDEFRKAVARLRAMYDDPAITTDIIVGFPGETREQFEETVRLVEEIGFSDVHVFPYSARPGTPAARLPGQVSPAVKKKRAERLREVASRCSEAYRKRFETRDLAILVEKIEAAEGGGYVASGYSTNYLHRTTEAGPGTRLGDIVNSPKNYCIPN